MNHDGLYSVNQTGEDIYSAKQLSISTEITLRRVYEDLHYGMGN